MEKTKNPLTSTSTKRYNLQLKNMENGLSKRLVTNKIAALWHKRKRQINGYIAQTVGLLFKK